MATREEIYTAIRNADQAGDSAAVRKLGAYLATLPPEGSAPKPLDASATNEMAMHRARLAQLEAEEHQRAASGPPSQAWDVSKDLAKGAADTALNLGSQALAVPVAGLAGLRQGAYNLAAEAGGEQPGISAADRVAQASKAM